MDFQEEYIKETLKILALILSAGTFTYVCRKCGVIRSLMKRNKGFRCPNCGSRMEEGEIE